MNSALIENLKKQPLRWLVTGAAGFIGSHLVEKLLNLGQSVVGLDDFSTGSKDNLSDIEKNLSKELWTKFSFVQGDIREIQTCQSVCQKIDIVLHQAALGSVTRSIADPKTTHSVNVDGFFNILMAARDAKVKRFVYASSSSVYGDNAELPKREASIGRPLSPYALSKRINEQYAQIFSDVYGIEVIGLRYFNVFGSRQNPTGEYAAVIPRWINACISGEDCEVFGNSTTSRDFCYVENVVEANILSALASLDSKTKSSVLNIGGSKATELKTLFTLISQEVSQLLPNAKQVSLKNAPPRPGDILHSLADISAAKSLIHFTPLIEVDEGLNRTVKWYVHKHGN